MYVEAWCALCRQKSNLQRCWNLSNCCQLPLVLWGNANIQIPANYFTLSQVKGRRSLLAHSFQRCVQYLLLSQGKGFRESSQLIQWRVLSPFSSEASFPEEHYIILHFIVDIVVRIHFQFSKCILSKYIQFLLASDICSPLALFSCVCILVMKCRLKKKQVFEAALFSSF